MIRIGAIESCTYLRFGSVIFSIRSYTLPTNLYFLLFYMYIMLNIINSNDWIAKRVSWIWMNKISRLINIRLNVKIQNRSLNWESLSIHNKETLTSTQQGDFRFIPFRFIREVIHMIKPSFFFGRVGKWMVEIHKKSHEAPEWG